MSWVIALVVAGGAIAVARIVFNIRRLRAENSREDWDARLVARLRAAGSDPFKPHEVDFFLGLPSEAAARSVAAQLEGQGMTADVRPVPDSVDQPFGVHVRRSMQLSIEDMREHSRRFRALAEQHGGRYDGWAAAPVHTPAAQQP